MDNFLAHLLVVDDDDGIRSLVKKYLSENNYLVTTAENAEMANEKMHIIREETFEKFNLSCMHIYHSLGEVKAGEICLFVFVSSPRRKEVFTALEYLVERIKSEAPIFGKELFEDQTHQWKVNS